MIKSSREIDTESFKESYRNKWWYMLIIPELGRLRQGDCDFWDSLDYKARYRPTLATIKLFVSKKKRQTNYANKQLLSQKVIKE